MDYKTLCENVDPSLLKKLREDNVHVSEFKQIKAEQEAQKNWDLFYKRNKTNFFKDRHRTTREFLELCGQDTDENVVESLLSRPTFLEVGCGVGNLLFPLVKENCMSFYYACDFSPRAVEYVKQNEIYDSSKCHVFQCDLTKEPLNLHMDDILVDIVTLVFVLSSIHPDKMSSVLKNIYNILKPGGVLLFRDYAFYDHAMLRFSHGHKLGDQFYVRQDGTRAFYFKQEQLESLCAEAGFSTLTSEYKIRKTENKKQGLCVNRVYLQAKFGKPNSQESSNS